MEDIFDNELELQEEQTSTESVETGAETEVVDQESTNELSESAESENDTEESTEKPKEKKKEDKLNPYEKLILDEMWRRTGAHTEGAEIDQLLIDGLESKDKNIHACFQYITAKARKKAVSGCAMIEDAEVYGWAHHYYIEPKKVIDAELHPKQKAKTTTDTPAKKAESQPKPVAKDKPAEKPKKKSTYKDNPLLKSVMGKSKKTAKKADTDDTPKGDEIKVKKNGKVFTITEFTLF